MIDQQLKLFPFLIWWKTNNLSIYYDATKSGIPRIIECWLFLLLFFIPGAEGQINQNILAPSSTQLYLELVINGNPTHQILPVKYKNSHFYMSIASLKKIGFNLDKIILGEVHNFYHNEIALDLVSNLLTKYDPNMQRFFMDVPYSWLPEKKIRTINYPLISKDSAKSSFGGILNYDWYFNTFLKKNKKVKSSLWSEIRLFNRIGMFSHTGILRINSLLNPNIKKSSYIRYETQWSMNNESHMLHYIIGDYTTDVFPGYSPVRMVGIKVSRQFTIHPDRITYSLPHISGYANMPSILDVYMNNDKIISTPISPGKFQLLNNLGYFNGYNMATILTSDLLGRSKRITVPCYVDRNILNVGSTDFSLSLGSLRRHYGRKSFDYDSDMSLRGFIRYGLAPWITVNTIVESTKNFFNIGLGGDIKCFLLGIVNISWSISSSTKEKRTPVYSVPARVTNNIRSLFKFNLNSHKLNESNWHYTGQQINLGYTYQNKFLNLNAQYNYRIGSYSELLNYASHSQNYFIHHFTQINGTINLSKSSNVSVSFLQNQDLNKKRLKELNISYSTSLGRDINLWTSINKYTGKKSGYKANLMLSIPLNSFGNTSFVSEVDEEHNSFISQSWNRSIPSYEGIGWNVTFSKKNTDDNFHQANIIWKNKYFYTQAGLDEVNNSPNLWLQLSGAVVAIGKYINFSSPINDGFVLISTNGYQNIPIFYENSLIGKTNRKGYLLVSSVPSWYSATISIDPKNISPGINIPYTIRKFILKDRSGYIVNFDLSSTHSAFFSVIDQEGHFLPAGSLVRIRGTSKITWSGLQGEVFIKDINKNKQNLLIITRSDNNTTCKVVVDKTSEDGISTPGLQLCK
ncbi:MAG: fimbria/pilus outer membrane usher protein [Candidatus Dasytiphilus stammeri]